MVKSFKARNVVVWRGDDIDKRLIVLPAAFSRIFCVRRWSVVLLIELLCIWAQFIDNGCHISSDLLYNILVVSPWKVCLIGLVTLLAGLHPCTLGFLQLTPSSLELRPSVLTSQL